MLCIRDNDGWCLQTINTMQRHIPWCGPLKHSWTYVEPYVWACASIAQTCAVWLVVILTTDRYIAICRPLHACQYSTRSRARRAVIVVWVLSVLYNLPRFFERNTVAVTDPVSNVTTLNVCKSALRENVAYILVYKTILFFIVRFFVPLSALAYLNMKLINAIRRSLQLQNKQSQRASCRRSTRTSIERYSSMLVIVVLVFLLCEIPDFVLRIWISLHLFFPSLPFPFALLRIVNVVSNLFLTFNSCVNFLIYCFMGRTFRKILVHMFTRRGNRSASRSVARSGRGFVSVHGVSTFAASQRM